MKLTFITRESQLAHSVCPDQTTEGFSELGTYQIHVPPELPSAGFLVDEERLPEELIDGRRCWVWRPGFYAGQVRAELRSADQALASYILDVSPDPAKLGRERFAAMVEELRAFRAGFLLGTEPARIAIGAGGAFRSAHLEYGRLRAYGRQLVQALGMVAERPLQSLRHRRDSVSLHRVRRVDQQTLTMLARSPFATAIACSTEMVGEAPDLLLDVPAVEETVDTPANRALLFFLRAVLARVRQVREDLELEAQREEEATRTAPGRRWPERARYLDELDAALRRISRRPPFSLLSGAEISSAGLNAISASPLYGRTYRLAWWILRHGIEPSETTEQQWMIPTWEVFERWCFLRVLEQVSALAAVSPADWRVSFVGQGGARAALSGELEMELRLQDVFPAWDNRSATRASLSRERCPDITLAWRGKSAADGWIALDAKYRVSRASILDAMASAHIYRDALRLHGGPPSVSLLLTPAACGAPWLSTPEFIERERVGVVDASTATDLRDVLRKILPRPS